MDEELKTNMATEEAEASSEAKKKKKKVNKEESEEASYDIFEDAPRSKDKAERNANDLEEVSAIHEFREVNNVQKRLRIAARSWLILVLCVGIFIGGSYLIYADSEETNWHVKPREHVHTWGETGDYYPGNCQVQPYTVYHCTYPYCTETQTIRDNFYGPHQFPLNSEVQEEHDGHLCTVYTCEICGYKRYVPIP